MTKKATLKGAEAATNLSVKGDKYGQLTTTGEGNTTTPAAQAAQQNLQNAAQNNTTSTTAQTLADEFAAARNDANMDPTAQAQATTKEEVEAQDSRTRLWQSLQNSYNQQIEKSEADYTQAKESANRQALSRGMQRSSYALDTLASLDDKSAKATRDILSAQIADYQNRLGELEQREQQQANWQAEFDAGRADAAWNQEWQQKLHADELAANDQKIAYDMVLRMLETNDKPSDELLKRAGISRVDYNQMKSAAKKSSGSRGGSPKAKDTPGADEDPDWKKAGYSSEREYLKAMYAANLDNNNHHDTSAYWTSGTTRDEYQKKQAQLNGIGKKK